MSSSSPSPSPSSTTSLPADRPIPVALTAVGLALAPLQQPEDAQFVFPSDVQHEYEKTYVRIINCDHQFCPELPQLYMSLLHLGAELFYPKEFEEFERCRMTGDNGEELTEEESNDRCLPGFEAVVEQLSPSIERHLQYRRERYSNDPLSSYYDPFQFGDPMWFIGALNVWRRQQGGSKTVSLRDCEPFVETFERCMKDNNNSYDDCFFEHFNSAICEPGFNCPSIQPSILQCAQTQNDSQMDLENCFKRLDHFLPCALGERREIIPHPDEIKGAAI